METTTAYGVKAWRPLQPTGSGHEDHHSLWGLGMETTMPCRVKAWRSPRPIGSRHRDHHALGDQAMENTMPYRVLELWPRRSL